MSGWQKGNKNKDAPVRELPKIEDFFKRGEDLVHTQGLKIMIWGPTATGKTHFAMSAPPPIFILDTEFGSAPLLRHFPDKDIYIYEAAVLDEESDEPDAEKSLRQIELAIATLKDVEQGTIVIDSGTDIWSWMAGWVEQQARKRGKMTKADTPQRLEWGRANLRWRQLILRLMSKPVHFVITAQMTEEYSSRGEQLGTYKPRIQKQTPHLCDIIIRLEKVYKKGSTKPEFRGTLTKCRFERSFDEAIEDVTFDKLCAVLKDKLGVVVQGVDIA